MMKNFKEFNQKLKEAASTSLPFEKFDASKSREESPKDLQPTKESKTSNKDDKTRKAPYRCTCPNVIRFKEDDEQSLTCWSEFERTVTKPIDVSQLIKESAKTLERILKMALADTTTSSSLRPTGMPLKEFA